MQQRAPAAEIAAARQRQRRRNVDDDAAVEVVPRQALRRLTRACLARPDRRRRLRAGDQRRLAGVGGADQQVPRDAVAEVDAAHRRAQPLQRGGEGGPQLAHHGRERDAVIVGGDAGRPDRQRLRARAEQQHDDRRDRQQHEQRQDHEPDPHASCHAPAVRCAR
jgi:hypothetical protein